VEGKGLLKGWTKSACSRSLGFKASRGLVPQRAFCHFECGRGVGGGVILSFGSYIL